MGIIYLVILWIAIMCIAQYEGNRITKYIEKKYPLESNCLKNEFGKYKIKKFWLFMKKISEDDPISQQLYNNCKNFIVFVTFVSVSFPISGLIFSR